MSQITRTWVAFAALGAGLVHLALVVDSPLAAAIPLGVLGLVETAWGVLVFARTRLVAPRVARWVALGPAVLWSLLVVVATLSGAPGLVESLSLVPMAVASGFGLFVGVLLTAHLRRPAADTSAPPELPSAPRYLLALSAGAVVVGALATPALAATEAGRFAQPHGAHRSDFAPENDRSLRLLLDDDGLHQSGHNP